MPLTNMKVQKPQAPDAAKGTLITEESEYPYGLCIYLEEKQLEALGLAELPKIGAHFTLEARVAVTGANADADGKSRRLSLQITDLDLHDDKEKSDEQVAGRIYTVPLSSGGPK